MGTRGPAPRLTVVALEGAETTQGRIHAALLAFQDAIADEHVCVTEQRKCWRLLSEAVAAARHTVGAAERADIAQLASINMLSGAISGYTQGRMDATGLTYEPEDAA